MVMDRVTPQTVAFHLLSRDNKFNQFKWDKEWINPSQAIAIRLLDHIRIKYFRSNALLRCCAVVTRVFSFFFLVCLTCIRCR